jgi:hypothetical protein
MRAYLKNTQHKKELVEWFKLKAISSNLRTMKKENSFKKYDPSLYYAT